MKKIILLLAMALQYCTPAPKIESPEDIIKEVETGLIHPVYLEGDSTWTIEARMKHYHKKGISTDMRADNSVFESLRLT